MVHPSLLQEVRIKKEVLAVFHVALAYTEGDFAVQPRMKTVSEKLWNIMLEFCSVLALGLVTLMFIYRKYNINLNTNSMAREIVRQESRDDLGNRSRLWDPIEIYDVLKNDKGAEAIRSITAPLSTLENLKLRPNIFAKMSKLQFLDFHCKRLDHYWDFLPQGLESLPNELRYLRWVYYPLTCLPAQFSAEKLVILDLSGSLVEKLWHEVKNLVNLKKVKLRWCKYLQEMPDFSKSANLEVLDVSCCEELTSVHPSIFSLEKLEKLDLSGCSSLIKFSSDNAHLSSLLYLTLNDCEELREFSVTTENVIELDLSGICISSLPSSFGTSKQELDDISQRKYDVFINFRGKDIRHSFLGYLTEAFHQKQIYAFVDDKLEKGDEIWPSLVGAIEGSLISLTIFSENYSSSRWCLEELVKILECREKYGYTVIPKYSLTTLQNWKHALEKAADLSGIKSFDYKTEVELLGEIINIVNLALMRLVDDMKILLKDGERENSVVVGLERLKDKALITISNDNIVHMHDIIQEMGWEIVRQESVEEPGKRSRLRDPDEVYAVLKYNKGTESIRSIRTDLSVISRLKLNPDIFTKMTKLQFLYIRGEYERDDFDHFPDELRYLDGLQYLPNELRYFVWSHCPLKSLPENFSAENLVNLKNLKELKVPCSVNLKELPDLSEATNLEVLDIKGCPRLTSVSPSIFSLNKLKIMRLDYRSFTKIVMNNHVSSLSFFTLIGSIKVFKRKEISVTTETMNNEPASRMCSNVSPLSFVWQSKLEMFRKTKSNMDQCLLPSSFNNLRRERYMRVLDPWVLCLIEGGPVYVIDCQSLKHLLFSLIPEQFKGNSSDIGIHNYQELVGESVNLKNLEEVSISSFGNLKELPDHSKATNLEALIRISVFVCEFIYLFFKQAGVIGSWFLCP
ncbi:hypothetical protein VNO78_25604 [Psophocarpus tetragonolobus]|uniref:TIR domain-containing protein n=1 Tax=Psophocarpus tetragonolobus TaxID=3891 RepID=A0AAN9S6T9_PSOTE